MDDAALLALHRRLVATPSVSGEEAAIAGWLEELFREAGVRPMRVGGSLLVVAGAGCGDGGARGAHGRGQAPPLQPERSARIEDCLHVRVGGGWDARPVLLLDTHLDTVPPGPGWTRDPFAPSTIDGRVVGLGSNDAKASVAAMTAAFLALAHEELPFALALALVEAEETKGTGTKRVLAELASREMPLLGAVFGEPTRLDVAVAQKGLLLLELEARGESCHAANADALGAPNAALVLARDLLAVASVELAPHHTRLGATTAQPTVLRAGEARNVVPARASAVLDVRTTPAMAHRDVIARVRERVASQVRVLSDHLEPRETDEDALVVRAALAARPQARLYGSPTLSDLVYVEGAPAIKCGPGASERSHTADEWVSEEEIVEGARFYERLVRAAARIAVDVGAGLAPARGHTDHPRAGASPAPTSQTPSARSRC